MSFDKMKLEELREVAAEFGVDLPEKANKPGIVTELGESGITYDMWEAHLARVEAAKKEKEELDSITVKQPEFSEKVNKILVKMDRENPRFDTQGFTFTKEKPFALVPEPVVDEIFKEEGFRIATPNEAKEFYS